MVQPRKQFYPIQYAYDTLWLAVLRCCCETKNARRSPIGHPMHLYRKRLPYRCSRLTKKAADGPVQVGLEVVTVTLGNRHQQNTTGQATLCCSSEQLTLRPHRKFIIEREPASALPFKPLWSHGTWPTTDRQVIACHLRSSGARLPNMSRMKLSVSALSARTHR